MKKYSFYIKKTINSPLFINRFIEVIKNKIKLIKCTVYGYRNFISFSNRILIISKLWLSNFCGGLMSLFIKWPSTDCFPVLAFPGALSQLIFLSALKKWIFDFGSMPQESRTDCNLSKRLHSHA
ncbi:transposase [Staphylococcus auricularis]|uniref:transposase n=1 Tax=Staphylococcus auricularis TaxID=29379 RepID=UPI0014701E78|nr:transposase [Staphylococcus auricularis]